MHDPRDLLRKVILATVVVTFIWILTVLYFIAFAANAKAASSYQFVSTTPESYGVAPKDGSKVVMLVLKNTGTDVWCKECPNPFRLGTKQPQDRSSGFYDATWLAPNRIAMQELLVPPGANATFRFNVRPAEWATGGYDEHFAPLIEGVAWLPDIGLYWHWVNPAPVGTILFLWYGPDGHRWGSDASSAVVDTPVGGRYDSSDVNVMRRQLTQIRDAGFDFVILDWWFYEPYGRGAYVRNNAITTANLIRSEFPTLKYSFLIEPGQTYVPAYAYDDFYNAFGTDPQFFKHRGGKPTLFLYNTNPSPDSRFSQVQYDNADGDPRLHTMYWILQPPRIKNRMFTAFGSFDNRAGCGTNGMCVTIDPNPDGWLFNTQRDFAQRNRDNMDVLVWYGWNEYYEREQLEPHNRWNSTRNSTYLYDVTTDFIKNWWKR